MTTKKPRKPLTKSKPRTRVLAVGTRSAPSLVRWEYMTEDFKAGYIPRLRLLELGQAGWEMCGTVATTEPPSDLSSLWPGVVCFYFKRALPNTQVSRGAQSTPDPRHL